jgi:hypothetical protein
MNLKPPLQKTYNRKLSCIDCLDAPVIPLISDYIPILIELKKDNNVFNLKICSGIVEEFI